MYQALPLQNSYLRVRNYAIFNCSFDSGDDGSCLNMSVVFKEIVNPKFVGFRDNYQFGNIECVTAHRKTDNKQLCVVSKLYATKYAERMKNFNVLPDDVWVVTYPKCGKRMF